MLAYGDLRDQTGKPRPREFLYCRVRGWEYSANASDYFTPKDKPIQCGACGNAIVYTPIHCKTPTRKHHTAPTVGISPPSFRICALTELSKSLCLASVFIVPRISKQRKSNGASGDRTRDLLHAMQALSQLSYGPSC